MHTQRDVIAPRSIIAMAGGMFGFIAPTIVMDIATMSMSGGNSAAILQAAVQIAPAGARFIYAITVGICERTEPAKELATAPQARNSRHPTALKLQADNNKE